MTTEDETVREMLAAFNGVPLFDGTGKMTTGADRLRAAYQVARRAVLEEAARACEDRNGRCSKPECLACVEATACATTIRALASKEKLPPRTAEPWSRILEIAREVSRREGSARELLGRLEEEFATGSGNEST